MARGDLQRGKPMPTQLRAVQDIARAHRAAAQAVTREVNAALGRAAMADVRGVHSTIVDGRVQVTVQAMRYHTDEHVNAVARVIETVPGLVDLGIAGRIIRAYRLIGG